MEKETIKTGNIVVDTLNETMKKLRMELHGKRKAILNESIEQFSKILLSISPSLAGYKVEVSDYGFSIRREIDQWWKDIVEVKLQYNYDRSPNSVNRYKKLYDKPATLSWSSCNATEAWEVERGIIIGIMCQHFQVNSPEYGQLIAQFKQHHELMDNIPGEDELMSQISECEKQIKRIQQDEDNAAIIAIQNKGQHEHTEAFSYKYGQSRWKRTTAKKWYWEFKKKNYIFGYFNEQGTKCMLKDNMTPEELRSFIKYYFLKKA
jgi:hypothetical protein